MYGHGTAQRTEKSGPLPPHGRSGEAERTDSQKRHRTPQNSKRSKRAPQERFFDVYAVCRVYYHDCRKTRLAIRVYKRTNISVPVYSTSVAGKRHTHEFFVNVQAKQRQMPPYRCAPALHKRRFTSRFILSNRVLHRTVLAHASVSDSAAPWGSKAKNISPRAVGRSV